jgi:hypothetical protein
MALWNLSSNKYVAPSELIRLGGINSSVDVPIAKKAWRKPIGTYYKIRQHGKSFTPDQWMRTVIKELWVFSIAIWKQRNTELHGRTDGTISMEQRRKETATEAVLAVYQATIGNISHTDSVMLHHARIDEILKWTKEKHLDAYLASSDVIIDQSDESGLFLSFLGCIMRCGSGVIWF